MVHTLKGRTLPYSLAFTLLLASASFDNLNLLRGWLLLMQKLLLPFKSWVRPWSILYCSGEPARNDFNVDAGSASAEYISSPFMVGRKSPPAFVFGRLCHLSAALASTTASLIETLNISNSFGAEVCCLCAAGLRSE
jgi:hypothetical protein